MDKLNTPLAVAQYHVEMLPETDALRTRAARAIAKQPANTEALQEIVHCVNLYHRAIAGSVRGASTAKAEAFVYSAFGLDIIAHEEFERAEEFRALLETCRTDAALAFPGTDPDALARFTETVWMRVAVNFPDAS